MIHAFMHTTPPIMNRLSSLLLSRCLGQKAVLPIDLSSGSNGVGADEVIENGGDEEALGTMLDARRKS